MRRIAIALWLPVVPSCVNVLSAINPTIQSETLLHVTPQTRDNIFIPWGMPFRHFLLLSQNCKLPHFTALIRMLWCYVKACKFLRTNRALLHSGQSSLRNFWRVLTGRMLDVQSFAIFTALMNISYHEKWTSIDCKLVEELNWCNSCELLRTLSFGMYSVGWWEDT
jgi:hypothetical protein